jgi:hypothetical protein
VEVERFEELDPRERLILHGGEWVGAVVQVANAHRAEEVERGFETCGHKRDEGGAVGGPRSHFFLQLTSAHQLSRASTMRLITTCCSVGFASIPAGPHTRFFGSDCSVF